MSHKIKLTPGLIQDFYTLINNITTFMSLNLLRAETYCKSDACRKDMLELIKYSTRNCKEMGRLRDSIKFPISKHFDHNSKIVSKNLKNTITFIYQYLKWAEKVLRVHKEIWAKYEQPFQSYQQRYRDFHAKYF